jgi:RHS repeat-associated protein
MSWTAIFRRGWYWLLVLVGASLSPLPSQAQSIGAGAVPDALELRVLQQLFDATQGPQWQQNKGWPQQPADWARASVNDAQYWFGVQVVNGDVVGLSLSRNNLVGGLPPGWDQLTELQTLDLSFNRLSGALPDSLGPALVSLDLSYNQLTGPLPATWNQALALTFCALNDNQLSGSLPGGWVMLYRLETLRLQNNRLTGPLPADWDQYKALTELDVSYNRLSGALPNWSQSQLRNCALGGNRFTGMLPASLLQLPYLLYLGVEANQLTDVDQLGQSVPLTLSIGYNYLGYAALEHLYQAAQQPYPRSIRMGGQLPPPAVDTVHYRQGGVLTLQATGNLGQQTWRYQWQRQVGGQWVDLPGDTLVTRTLFGATDAQRGTYRLALRNRWFTNPGLQVLYSRMVYADLLPYAPLARNLPVDATRADQLGALLPAPDATASAPADMNYVRTFVPSTAQTSAARVALAPVDSVSRSTQYLDGLGRPVQTVQWQASPQRRDLVQPQAYDGLGRETRQYLPYAADTVGTKRLGYHAQPLANQQNFYASLPPTGPVQPTYLTRGVARTSVGYSESLFEASPLNRVVAQAAPGESWQLASGHAQQRLELPNTLADSVLRFAPDYTSQSLDPGYQGYYATGELWGTQTTDEHGNLTISWADKLGQVVLKQVEAGFTYQIVRTPPTNGSPFGLISFERRSRWLRTAYAYDDFGRLRYVLQPEGTKLLLPLGNRPTTFPLVAAPFRFHYRYDERGRQIAKQVPGQDGETLVVYDELDRPVLSQDPVQRTRQQWSWTKYDALGRPVLTGLVARPDGLDRDALQAQAAATTAQYEQRTSNVGAYPHGFTTNQAFPALGQNGFSAGQVLTVTHYDDYDFNNDGQADAQYDASTDAQFASGQAPVADVLRTTGLLTRTKTRVLGVADTDPQQAAWLLTTTFYDERARPVQVQSTNARKGTDLLTTQLDFAGQVVQSVTQHQGPNHAPVLVKEQFSYDHAGRLLTTRQQLPGEAQPAQIAAVQYNELGQVLRKTIGTGRLKQDVDFAYNSRGWLTSLNDPYQPDPADLFNLSLHYERGFSLGYGQYNGNLTGQTWRGRDGVQRAYGYVYDPLNRIQQGDFVARTSTPGAPSVGAWSQEQDRYRLSFVSYDDNGNIKTLRRRGLLQAANRLQGAQYGPTDELTYAYVGNRLQAVDDAVTGNQLPAAPGYHGAPTSLAGDFQEAGVHLAQEYRYDANGNLFRDQNKGITDILYNPLNLPRQIRFGTGADSVVFRYAASGQKVAKLVYQTGKTPQRTDYLGAFQYEADSLRFFPHAEGRVLRFVSQDPAGQASVRYQREYTVKDHLGNLRLAYRAGQVRTLLATLEPSNAERETQQFDSLSVSQPIAVPTPYARTNGWAAQLNAGGAKPQPLGPLTQLGVQKNDTVSVTAYGLYPRAQTQSFWFSFVTFLANLVGQQPPQPTGVGADPSRGRRNLPLLQVGVTTGLASLTQLGNGVPKGYLRVLVFNKDSVLVEQYTQQLSTAAHQNYEPLQVQLIPLQDGYVTAYVGNEGNVDVFFDDVTVEHRQGLQVQENQYDPWGLNLAGVEYSSPGVKSLNCYQFNGKEVQGELGLNWADYGARHYDKQLGRWVATDPLADKREWVTTYNFVQNNPLSRFDPNGLTDFTLNKETGEVKQVGKPTDQPDRILRTDKQGAVKTKKNGEPRVDIAGIEHGILKEGQNFKTEDNIIQVGGKGQPSVDGVKSFTLQLSEYIAKEIKGFSYSGDASGKVTDMLLGKYQNNSLQESHGGPGALARKYGSDFSLKSLVQEFHTHPDGKLGATESSPGISTDVRTLQGDRPQMPNASFIILYRATGQAKPEEYDYTHEYRPRKK